MAGGTDSFEIIAAPIPTAVKDLTIRLRMKEVEAQGTIGP